MIEKLDYLKDIGQFELANAGKDLPFSQLTIIYGENGRGKTTLTSIFRSLAENNPDLITERATLGSTTDPCIVIRLQGQSSPLVFKDGAWSSTFPGIEIFDEVFVDENVHSGLTVASYHRQNLHELILGSKVVALNLRLQSIVDEIEAHNQKLRILEEQINAEDLFGMSVVDFCGLQPQPQIDEAIESARKDLDAVKTEESVVAAAYFKALDLPRIDLSDIEEALLQDLPTLASQALKEVQEHIATLGWDSEAWLAEGVQRVASTEQSSTSNRCPFCAQDLSNSPIITHYQAYFSDAYRDLKTGTIALSSEITRYHGESALMGFAAGVQNNMAIGEFWAAYCAVPDLQLDVSAITNSWRTARNSVLGLLSKKQEAPLDQIELSTLTKAHAATYESHREAISKYNEELERLNKIVEDLKSRTALTTLSDANKRLKRLEAVKARFSAETNSLCLAYTEEQSNKASTVSARAAVQEELDENRSTAFPTFEKAVNPYLEHFNAGFKIRNLEPRNIRGGSGATCNFSVLINDEPVRVTSTTTPSAQPSFRSTLSGGDRNTLALSFFLASLDQDTNLKDKIVVIDDPISSMDRHRTQKTKVLIQRLVENAAQVIVLSHNRSFLRDLWTSFYRPEDTSTLEIIRTAGGSSLKGWDMRNEQLTEHDRRDKRFRVFVDEGIGNKLGIAQDIRSHLEHFLRVAFPADFTIDTKIGAFVNECRDRVDTDREIMNKEAFRELEELHAFQWQPHHEDWSEESTDDQELRGFVERTLDFTRK